MKRLVDWIRRALARVPNRYVGNALSWLGLLYAPLDKDLPLREAIYKAWRRPLTAKVGWLHVFGAVALLLVLVLVVSGVLLSFHYEPSQESARASVLYVMTDVTSGWLIRGVHRWAGDLLVLLVIVHVIRTFFARAYRSPRTANWVVGLLILPVVLGFQFTGEVLPWDQDAYWRSVRANELGSEVPVWGSAMTHVSAGPDLSNVGLVRYFALHVIILPWVLFFLLSFHLRLIRRHGLAPPLKGRQASPGGDLATLVVLRNEATDAQVEHTVALIEDAGGSARVVTGREKTLIHAERCARSVVETLGLDPVVEELVPLSRAAGGTAFFPRHLVRVLSALLLTLGGLIMLAAYATPIVGAAADPFQRPESVDVKWYFLWFEQLRTVLPDWLGFLAPLLFVVLPIVGFLWPLIDRCDAAGPRRRWLAPVVGIVVLTLFVALTLGALS